MSMTEQTHQAGPRSRRHCLLATLCGAVLSLAASQGLAVPTVANVAKDPTEVPKPVRSRPGGASPKHVAVTLTAQEVIGEIAPGVPYWFWTWKLGLPGTPDHGTVPGPMLRVMEGDTLDLTICNDENNIEPHNIDFHAVLGPGGGAAVTNVERGECKSASFKLTKPGAFMYHCAAEGKPWEHVANGMYGLIMVEPKGGLAAVDKEFYIGQGDWYLTDTQISRPDIPNKTFFSLDEDKAGNEFPVSLYTFNGHTQALGGIHPLIANQDDKVRFFFVVGGPNVASNWHIIGTVFDRVYKAAPRALVDRAEETVVVPPGSAIVAEMTTPVPGRYLVVDHALYRASKGAAGVMTVVGRPDPKCDPSTGMVMDPGSWPLDLFSPATCGTGH